MFTGLVQNIGLVRHIRKSECDLRLEIETSLSLENINIGASICCSGCCLTVVEKTKNSFFVDLSSETLQRTKFSVIQEGDRLNLEPSLKMGDELGGHFVFGHVDATMKILGIDRIGESHKIEILLPEHLKQFVAEKGSVALDGVSLTVNAVTDHSFFVNIIPHTWEVTTLSDLTCDSIINLEIDMLARYVERMLVYSK